MDYLHNKIHHIKYIKSQHKLEEKKTFYSTLFVFNRVFHLNAKYRHCTRPQHFHS